MAKKNDDIKITGAKLKKTFDNARNTINNVQNKAFKKINLIKNNYPQYLTDDELEYLNNDQPTITKLLDIIIKVENRYVKENSNQINIFNS